MKKIITLFGMLFFGCMMFLFPSFGHAQHLEEIQEYVLTGEKLDKFEEKEQVLSKIRQEYSSNEDYHEKYAELIEKGVIGKDVDYSTFLLIIQSPEPTDPVIDEFRSVAGNPEPGDIMITNHTSSNGLTGHAGIFLSNGMILSISGPNDTPKGWGIIKWTQEYLTKDSDYIKIYRPKKTYNPAAAAKWADQTYRDKTSIKYKITSDLYSTNPTYCSKIVWQAYAAVNVYSYNPPLTGGIVLPYDLPTYFTTPADHVGTWKKG